MASSTKKTRHTYVFEFNEEELKVLANVFYRVQLGMTGPGSVASDIYAEIDKYCYVDEYDPEGTHNWIPMIDTPHFEEGPALYWCAPYSK